MRRARRGAPGGPRSQSSAHPGLGNRGARSGHVVWDDLLSYAGPVPERLSDIGIQRELGGLPGWSRRGDSLTKTYRFPTFPAGITFLTRVADVAESMNHHPDIDVRHTRLTFTLSTHDAGGITTRDLTLAREIERLAAESGV